MRNSTLQNTFQTSALECRWTYGMGIKSRAFQGFRDFRYGFNGQEKDDEIKGSGNSVDFGARIYDPRIGRWLSIDPLSHKYPGYSPYSFGLDNPVYFQDADGRVIIDANGNVVTVNQDDKGNITFNPDVAPATKDILGYYLKSDVGKTQLKKMDATVTKITLEVSQQAAFSVDSETGEFELILGITETSGKATEASGEKTFKSAKIIVFAGSIELQSEDNPTLDPNEKYAVYTDDQKVFQEKGSKITKNKNPAIKPDNPGPHQTNMMKDKEYAKEATFIHESEHTTKEQYKTDKTGGDLEQGPIQKEKDLYKERNSPQ